MRSLNNFTREIWHKSGDKMRDNESEVIAEIQRQGRMTRWTIVLSTFGACTGIIIFLIDPWGLLLLGIAVLLILLAAVAGGVLGKSGAMLRNKIAQSRSRTSQSIQ